MFRGMGKSRWTKIGLVTSHFREFIRETWLWKTYWRGSFKAQLAVLKPGLSYEDITSVGIQTDTVCAVL